MFDHKYVPIYIHVYFSNFKTVSGLYLRVRTKMLIFLFLNQNI